MSQRKERERGGESGGEDERRGERGEVMTVMYLKQKVPFTSQKLQKLRFPVKTGLIVKRSFPFFFFAIFL